MCTTGLCDSRVGLRTQGAHSCVLQQSPAAGVSACLALRAHLAGLQRSTARRQPVCTSPRAMESCAPQHPGANMHKHSLTYAHADVQRGNRAPASGS